MEQQTSLSSFLKGGSKGSHQMVRQVSNKAHGIAKEDFFSVGKDPFAGSCIKRGEKLILGQNPRPG